MTSNCWRRKSSEIAWPSRAAADWISAIRARVSAASRGSEQIRSVGTPPAAIVSPLNGTFHTSLCQRADSRFSAILGSWTPAAGAELRGQREGALRRGPSELAQCQRTRMVASHLARRGAIGRDERQAADDAVGAEKSGQRFVRTQSVLQRQKGGLRSEQGWEKSVKLAIGRRFEGDDHEIDRADLGGRAVNSGRPQLGQRLLETQPQGSPGPDRGQIGAQEEAHVGASEREANAVIEADRARPDDGYFGRSSSHGSRRGAITAGRPRATRRPP